MEALLLGGHTATLQEGRVTQFGETAKIYRRPVDLCSARVFSDPPINTAEVIKKGDRFTLNDDVSWTADGNYLGLADGGYIVGIRPHHISPAPGGPQAVTIRGKVLVTELSGSESVVHFALGDRTWVSQSQGIHSFEVGALAKFYMNSGKFLYFTPDEKLIAA
jgi:glycerol transport system ATP-binding protein